MAKKEEKQVKVQEIEQKLNDAKMVVLTDYRGLKVSEINDLRNKLKAIGADYRVVKNTITRFAVQNAGLEDILPHLEGPNALLFSGDDVVEPAKILFDFGKNHPQLQVKMGLLEGQLIDANQMKIMSTLPSREVLLARVLGGMQAPLYGLAYVLQANLSGLARVLNGIKEQKAAS